MLFVKTLPKSMWLRCWYRSVATPCLAVALDVSASGEATGDEQLSDMFSVSAIDAPSEKKTGQGETFPFLVARK